MKQRLLQLKFEARSLIAREPLLAWPHHFTVWWTQHKVGEYINIEECRVGQDTEFVLDGFQGSGNSFATVAFKRCQRRTVNLAHHLHSPAQIIKAVHLEIPTLITIREPRGAALSLTSRWPYVTVQQALRSYIRFYTKIEPYVEHLVLSPFEKTTGHLDEVFAEVNRKFGTQFDLFLHSEEDMLSLRDPEKLNSEEAINRKALKQEQAKGLETKSGMLLLKQAETVFSRLEPFGV